MKVIGAMNTPFTPEQMEMIGQTVEAQGAGLSPVGYGKPPPLSGREASTERGGQK